MKEEQGVEQNNTTAVSPSSATATMQPAQSPQHAPTKTAEQKELSLSDTRPKTRGDTFYDITQFLIGKVFILAATAVLAFTADSKYGPEKIGPVPNVLKKLQVWLENATAPMQEWGKSGGKVVSPRKNDMGILLAAGTASTIVLSWGGTLFSPFIKWLENNREGITNWYNKKFGTKEEVEITKEKYKDMPKQNWNDVLKGRAMAYATVFGAVTGAFLVGGRSSKPHLAHFKLQSYEEWVGRKIAWLSKSSREISKVPMEKKLSDLQKSNKVYRFGKVLAIDLFATTTAIIVWNTVSRLSAKKRVAEEKAHNGHHPQPVTDPNQGTQDQSTGEEKHFTDTIQPSTNRAELLSQKSEEKESFSNIVTKQRTMAEAEKTPAVSG